MKPNRPSDRRPASTARGPARAPARGLQAASNAGSRERDAAPARPPEDGAVPRPRPARPAVHPVATRIDQVRGALGEILQWAGPADQVLSRWFRDHPKLGVRDRGEVAEAVYDVLRHLRRYRQIAEGGRGAATRRLAVLGLAATLGRSHVRPALDETEAEWLQRVGAISPDSLPREVRLSVPDWLAEALAIEEDSDSLFAALNRPAPLDIRVNPMKVDRDTVLAELRAGAADAKVEPTPYSPFGIRLQGRPPLNRWSRFEDGSIEVQDEGSQLLALLVAPRRGEMVIDFCAGAGGKTLLLGALMRSTGRLYALDVSQSRLAKFKPRMARSGLSNVVPVVIASENDPRVKRLARKAHRVLVDAPCSGIGTLRRNPDLKWRHSPESVSDLCVLQRSILASAARCVAPGGRLVYATCSMLRVENEDQAEHFLATHPEFQQVSAAEILNGRAGSLALSEPYLRLRPDVHGTDGFFAAVFERRMPAKPPLEALAAEALPESLDDEAGNELGPETAPRVATDDDTEPQAV